MKFIIIFLGISTFCFSQKFSFIYEAKYKLSPEQPDYVISDNMILDLKNNTSIFRDLQDKNSDSVKLNNGNGRYKMVLKINSISKRILLKKELKK